MGREPVLVRGRPCDWPGCAASTNPSVSFTHLLSLVIDRKEAEVRYIGLDVHREFCEVGISEEGRVRSAGRVRTRRAELELFAQSLGKDDEVALESTGGAEAIAGILRPHVARVAVVNTKKLRAISEAKAKTDRLDARRLAELLAAGFLAEVWCPDEGTRALRRYVARRGGPVGPRPRGEKEIGGALKRHLLDRPPVYDLAGVKGGRFLEGLELPADERNTVEGCLRQITFLDEEIAEVDRALSQAALGSAEMRRLMTVPGVNLHTAATFMACVGTSGASPRRASSSPTSGSTPRFASPARSRRATATSPRRAPRRPGTCSARRPGSWSEARARCAPAASGSGPGAVPASPRSRSPASSGCCSGICSRASRTMPSAGPPWPARSSASSSFSPAPRGARASPASGARTRRGARQNWSSPARPRPPTDASSPTGSRRRARTRHRDAHLYAVKAASSAAGLRSQTLRFSSSSPAPTGSLARSGQRVQRTLDLHRSREATAHNLSPTSFLPQSPSSDVRQDVHGEAARACGTGRRDDHLHRPRRRHDLDHDHGGNRHPRRGPRSRAPRRGHRRAAGLREHRRRLRGRLSVHFPRQPLYGRPRQGACPRARAPRPLSSVSGQDPTEPRLGPSLPPLSSLRAGGARGAARAAPRRSCDRSDHSRPRTGRSARSSPSCLHTSQGDKRRMIIVLIGVAGSGKTTLGQMLAARLHLAFLDADELHTPEAVEQMTRGEPLTDAQRNPWFTRVVAAAEARDPQVLACSALRRAP